MTLREQLADRIGGLAEEAAKGRDGYMHVPYGLMLMIAADECIRQMEWAFREGIADSFNDERGTNISALDIERGAQVVTLAPEDWKP